MAKQISDLEVYNIKQIVQSNRSTTLRRSALLGMSFACALTLIACDGNKNKDVPKETTDNEGSESVELEPVSADAKKVCSDTSLVAGLKDAVKNTVVQQSKIFAAAHGQNANLSIDMNSVTQRANKILVDIKDIKASSSSTNNGMVTCQASVSMTLPTEDISSATKMYAANGQGSLEQRVTSSNMKLVNNTVVNDKFTFEVNPQSASPEAKVVGQPSILQVAADVMATSALKSHIDNGAGKVTPDNAPVKPTTQSRKPITPQVKQLQPTAPQKTQAQKRAEQKKVAQRRAARKAAADKKAAINKKVAADKKAAAQRRKARKAAEATAVKKAAEKKLSLQKDGIPKAQEAAKVAADKRAKINAQKISTELAKAKAAKAAADKRAAQAQYAADKKASQAKTAPVSSDSASKKIEMVIVEEEGTY